MQINISEVSILFYLILADYITGISVAFIEKKLKSSIGKKGIFEKFGMMMCVFVCSLIDSLNLSDTQIQPLVVLFFIANESISIFENLAKLNVPIPSCLLSRLKDFKEKIEKK